MDAATKADRTARITLSALSEPGDAVTGALVRRIGAEATLALLEGGATPPEGIDGSEFELWRRRTVPRLDRGQTDRILETTEQLGMRVLTPADTEWPAELEQLGVHAPIVLWARGHTPLLAGPLSARIGVVGARAATSYGEHIASEIAAEIAGCGRTVISGGAYGIDGAAHRAAMAARPGSTVAVMAAGLDCPYPVGHTDLFERIRDRGSLLLSELPPGAAPTRWRFMQRNRILAALTGATVIVEAGYRSGALDIAARAHALGRPVGAVPGPVTSAASAGCHRLLQEGVAHVVTNAQDAVDLIGTDAATRPQLAVAAPSRRIDRPTTGLAL